MRILRKNLRVRERKQQKIICENLNSVGVKKVKLLMKKEVDNLSIAKSERI